MNHRQRSLRLEADVGKTVLEMFSHTTLGVGLICLILMFSGCRTTSELDDRSDPDSVQDLAGSRSQRTPAHPQQVVRTRMIPISSSSGENVGDADSSQGAEGLDSEALPMEGRPQPVPVPELAQGISEDLAELLTNRNSDLEKLCSPHLLAPVPRLEQPLEPMLRPCWRRSSMRKQGNRFGDASRLDPNNPQWLYYLAHIDRVQGELELAATGYLAYLEAVPDDPGAIIRLAQMGISSGAAEPGLAWTRQTGGGW